MKGSPLGGYPTLEEARRFWARVESGEGNGCWIFGGFPMFFFRGRQIPARRVAFAIVNGDPGARRVFATCQNRRCVNPEHLTLSKPMPVHGPAKLTDRQVRRLRRQYRKGTNNRHDPGNAGELAKRYGITRNYVNILARGKARETA